MCGVGANTALRDAADLCRAIAGAAHCERHLLPAIREYEQAMRERGYRAVHDSLRATRQATATNRAARAGVRTFLRACHRLLALRRKIFADQDQ